MTTKLTTKFIRMKKSLVLGILGLTAGAASCFGSNFILLDSYMSEPTPTISYGANVRAYGGSSGAFGTVGAGLNSGWTVGFYFALGVVAADAIAGSGPVSPLLTLAT